MITPVTLHHTPLNYPILDDNSYTYIILNCENVKRRLMEIRQIDNNIIELVWVQTEKMIKANNDYPNR